MLISDSKSASQYAQPKTPHFFGLHLWAKELQLRGWGMSGSSFLPESIPLIQVPPDKSKVQTCGSTYASAYMPEGGMEALVLSSIPTSSLGFVTFTETATPR